MKFSGRVVSVSAVLFALLLLAPLSARAQMRMSGGARLAMRPMRVLPGPSHIVRMQRAPISNGAPRQFHPSGTPPASFGNQFDNGYGYGSGETLGQLLDPVPGLGFDYSYLNAINSDLGIKAVIDPRTEWELATAERVARITGGYGYGAGAYLLDGGGDYIVPAEPASGQAQDSQQPQQPMVIVVKEQANQHSDADETPAVAPQPATPLPNVSNFTLVLQNGTKIQAIAFTRVGDKIVYIASDGSRHTLPASELDSSATEQLNADSGTQLRF
jgi:hypothetical protein